MLTKQPTNAVKIQSAKLNVGNKHPLKDQKSHDKLLEFIKGKMDSDKTNRQDRISRFAAIDSAVSGWIKKYSDADQERKEVKDETGEPAVVKQNLSLIQMHLDDMTAFYLDVFIPTRGAYFAMGDAGDNDDITKMAKLLSQHGKNSGRVMELNRFFTNAMKYNLGGIYTSWKVEKGTILSNDENDGLKTEQDQVTWQGNHVRSLDMYNTFWDSNCDAIDLYRYGEWFAEVDQVSSFTIMRENQREMYSNLNGYFTVDANRDNTYQYYKSPPSEAEMDEIQGRKGQTNFADIWAVDQGTRDTGTSHERVNFLGFLSPKEFGIGADDKYKLYNIVVLGNRRIVRVQELNNAHGWMPVNFARPIDDQMGGCQKSFSEVLSPLQDFASFCLNTHSEAVRSKIYGTRIYNSTYIDVDNIPKGEVNMNIPTKAGARDINMSNLVHKLASDVDTDHLMNALNQVMDLANNFFPATQMPSQVAGIDRAVNSQVAAAVQGANKRLKKYGRVIIDQCMEPSKRIQIQNSQQYFKDDESVNEGDGLESIAPKDLRNITVSANIGHGLMTLDRDKMVNDLKDLLNAVLQSQAASQQVDVVAMLNSVGTFMDYSINFDAFRLQQQPEQPPEGGQGEENVPQGIPQGDGGGEIPAA